MKEKKEMNVEFENTMEAIVNTLECARLSKDSDNPQVFEVKFKLPGSYSSRSDLYRLMFDPNHLDNLGFAGDSLFLYKGDGFFDKMMVTVIPDLELPRFTTQVSSNINVIYGLGEPSPGSYIYVFR